MKLYIFPSKPITTNGYGIAVKSDLEKLNPSSNDVIIWYENNKETIYNNDIIIPRPGKYDISRFINVLKNRVNCELSPKAFKGFNLNNIDDIFCGEVIFYRALRKLFPNKAITVRFHNCFARIKDRIRLIDADVNMKMDIHMRAYYQLEKEIFQDRNAYKIFISNEDRDYYTSHFGILTDSEVWGFVPDMNTAIKNRIEVQKTKLVHLGGMQAHKIDAMKWFIKDVFTPLHAKIPILEFHLWGSGSTLFNNISNGIFGHGFYEGNGLPEAKEGLFINPDIIGGGVKIKMIDYIEKGASFISTPYGYEGYPKEIIDNKFYFVIEREQWLPFLTEYFKDLK